MNENRNILIAITLSVIILITWTIFYEQPRIEAYQEQQIAAQKEQKNNNPKPKEITDNIIKKEKNLTRSEIIDNSQNHRIIIKNDNLRGSFSLKGLRFDDLELINYRTDLNENSKNIKLLSPSQSSDHYFIDFGFISMDKNLDLPNSRTIWASDSPELSPNLPVNLSWTSKDNILFQIQISLDENYLFDIKKSVKNLSDKDITLASFGRVNRNLLEEVADHFILHEGAIGIFDKLLNEVSYSDLVEEREFEFQADSGWLGITDKYWLTALIPDQDSSFNSIFSYAKKNQKNIYKTEFISSEFNIESGDRININHHFFAGAKILSLLDNYEQELNIYSFDKAVDFGWYYFLTKPFFFILHIFSEILGNYGLAILAMTLLVKLAMFPLAHKSFTAIGRMKKFQPQIMRIREENKDNKVEMNRQIMELYKREGVNPAAGCLPMMVQIPVFFSLYKVLFVTIDMRHAPFYGWIKDLSAPDPTSIFNLFGLLPFSVDGFFLQIGIWPILMGLTMILQQKLSPAPADPMQAKMMKMLPIILIFVFAAFPSGLLIYWTFSNLLSITQQYYITRKLSK